MEEIQAAWKGNIPLVRAFWAYYFIGQIFIAVMLGAIGALLDSIGLWYVTVGLVVLVVLPYVIWSSWSVWTCAFNVKRRPWGYVARLVIVINVIGIIQNFAE